MNMCHKIFETKTDKSGGESADESVFYSMVFLFMFSMASPRFLLFDLLCSLYLKKQNSSI